MGLFITVSTVVQIILGFISNARWTPDRKSIPWWDKLHWWFGRAVFILAIANCYIGIEQYKELGYISSITGISVAYWVFVIFGFGALIFGQFTMGQVRKSTSFYNDYRSH